MAALFCFVIANIGFELGMVFYNAFLPGHGTQPTVSVESRDYGLGCGVSRAACWH